MSCVVLTRLNYVSQNSLMFWSGQASGESLMGDLEGESEVAAFFFWLTRMVAGPLG